MYVKEAHQYDPGTTLISAMQRVPLNVGGTSDQYEGASRFAALVRCSVHEAQEWLRRSSGSFETALNDYLTQQRSPKRHKLSATPPRPCNQHLDTPCSPLTGDVAPGNPTRVRTGHLENPEGANSALLDETGQSNAPKGRDAFGGSRTLMIDLAGESDEEEETAVGEVDGRDGSNSSGELRDKGCSGNEVLPPTSVGEYSTPAVDDLPDDFSFCLGECVANGTVTSSTISKFSLTDPLTLMVEVRLPHTQRWGPQQGFRRAKLPNSGYRIVYIHLNDPILLEHQRRLGQPNLRGQCLDKTPLSTSASLNASNGTGGKCSSRCNQLAGLDFHNLLSSISEQTTFLRLLIDGREAVRFDREVASALAPLLLLGAIKVDICWLPDRMPPRRLAINSNLSVRMSVHVTVQALRLSALRQRGDPYVSQVHFPVLIGGAFDSLLQLLGMQPVNTASSRQAEESYSADLGMNKEAEIGECLNKLHGPKRFKGSAEIGKDDANGELEPSLKARSRGFTGEDETGEDSDGTHIIDEDDEEVEERSDALCQLVLEGRATSDDPQRQPQQRRSLGTLYPPTSMFVSRLRPYQAQGLWWMLHCESEQRLSLEDESEELDPLWAKYSLSPAAAAYTTTDLSLYGSTPIQASSGNKTARAFVPRCFYVNTSCGLVSLEKPSTTGRVRGGILADCMGLGKTVQVLALIAFGEFQERDPKGAASWLAASEGGCARDTDATSSAAKPGCTADKLGGAPANESDTFASAQLSASPISVSSDGDAADLKEVNSIERPREVGRDSLLAVDPRILQRSLKRGRDNLLRGGTLIVVPLSLIGQWYAEVKRHLVRGVATVLQYYGTARPRDPKLLAAYTIVLTSYQTLASDFRQLPKHMQSEGGGVNCDPRSVSTLDLGSVPESPIASIRFRRIILDEGHVIKNTSSLVNRACNSVEADSRWILTGTPLQNDLSDAFALVQFLRVSPVGSRRWWRAKVTQAMEKGMVREAVETVRNILAPLMLRRHGDELGEDGRPLLPLPPLTIHTFTLHLTYEERLFYQTIFEHSKAKFDQLVQSGQVLQHYTHVLQLLLRLRQACNHPLLPSHREQQRRQQFIDAVCPAQDHPKYRSNDGVEVVFNLSSSSRPAPDFILQKYIQEALEGKLKDCPVCLEPPADAVVLTSCWHVLCVNCVLLLQNSKSGAVAVCPTCNSKFLHQHVRLLPCKPKASTQQWIDVVQKKHREALAAAGNNKESKHGNQLAAEEAQKRDKACLGADLHVASPTEQGSTHLNGSATVSEVALHELSDHSFFFSTKMRLLLALLDADVAAGRSCVIFSQWTSMLDLVEMAFARVETVRSTEQPDAPGATNDDDDNDVVEMGATHAVIKVPQFLSGNLSKEVTRGGNASPNQQGTPMKRLYNYRRIDGTLGLEARQRIIHWFSEDSLHSTARTVVSCTSRATETEGAPFMGQFNLQRFICTTHGTGASHRAGAPSPKPFTTGKPTSASKSEVDISPHHRGKILLLSLKTGNVGLNLVKATRCYIIDGWWNPQVEKQAMRRLWRYGQDQPVSVYRFVCARTVEERMEELIKWKGHLSRSTLRFGNHPDGESSVDPEEADADKRKGHLSLQDLKKLFEGWETGPGSA